MAIVLHLIAAAAWKQLGADERVTNASLENEGFIHCTDEPDVMLRVANEFYSGEPGDFVVLHVEVDALSSECVWEAAAHIGDRTGQTTSGGDADAGVDADVDVDADADVDETVRATLFPHVYGPIDRRAVLGVQPIRRDPSGRFSGYGDFVASA